MKNRIKGIFLTIVLSGCIFTIPVYAKETPDELKTLYAQSAVLMDADSGRILFGKNEKEVLPMASTTKIMTCILALENMKRGQICEVSDYAAKQPKVHLGMKSGEKYYLMDLLHSLMLESHNDSAVVIAEAIAGSVENFAALMNEKASEIGCTDTYFITPNGLDAEDDTGVHSTTAADLALIMRYCITQSPQRETFVEITRKSSYEFQDVLRKRDFVCSNHNSFLNMMDGALSGKTGFTNDAGYCYVGALKQGERTFIVALLACGWPNNKTYKWADTRKLMEYGLDNYKYRNIQKETEREKILVTDGMNILEPMERVVYIKTEVQNEKRHMKLLMSESEEIDVKIIQKKTMPAPVEKGEIVGGIFYILDGKIMDRVKIIAAESAREKKYTPFLKYLIKEFIL